MKRLRAEPSLIERAVEEMLRYCGPGRHTTSRFALQDTEFLGQRIPAGEMIMASLQSANHDPNQFEEPGRFDIYRTPNGGDDRDQPLAEAPARPALGSESLLSEVADGPAHPRAGAAPRGGVIALPFCVEPNHRHS